MQESGGPSVGVDAKDADAFDDRVATLNDYAVTLLASSLGRDKDSNSPGSLGPSAVGALTTVVLAVADARDKAPGDDAVLTELDRARSALARVLGAEGAKTSPFAELAGALDEARKLAIARAVRASAVAPSQPKAPEPLLASEGTPALHRDVRLEAAPRPLAPRPFGALRPERRVRPADATPAQKALSRWARDALEELAIAGRLRRPREDEAWTSGEGFERRALVSMDTLASLGRGRTNDERLDVARVIDDTLNDWSIPDPGRVFAATFALGCIDGHGAAARLHVHAQNLHATTAGAIEDALSLGESPRIDEIVLSLVCEDESPDLLERGLRVAKRRARVPSSLAIELVGHPDPKVAVAAASACALLDPTVSREALEAALHGPDTLAIEAAESLAKQSASFSGWSERATALASGSVESPITVRAARLRVLTARAKDVEPLFEICHRLPRAAALDLLGWLGSAKSLGELSSALRDPDFVVREQAAWSLARITGAGRDAVSVIETDDRGNPRPDPDPDPDEADLPDDFDPSRHHPPTDPAFWAEPCARAAALDVPRLRLGRPLSGAAVLEELLEPRTHQGIRRHLITELSILSSGRTPGLLGSSGQLHLDIDDWVARQRRLLLLALAAGATA